MLKMSVCCCTWNRPEMLGELIQSYLMQTYPPELRELIILDDAGQYGDVRGDGWQIVSFPRRFASLGEKRNACVSLASPESEGIVIADDDDIYLPHWLQVHARNFEQGALWSFASKVYFSRESRITHTWKYPDQGWLIHAGCGFIKEAFWSVGAYPHIAWMEDNRLFAKLEKNGIPPCDALEENDGSFLIVRRNENPAHVHATNMNLETYRKQRLEDVKPATLEIGWKRDYEKDVADFEKGRCRPEDTPS